VYQASIKWCRADFVYILPHPLQATAAKVALVVDEGFPF
jgi:hypothetical protein